jgi:hypothetical protein
MSFEDVSLYVYLAGFEGDVSVTWRAYEGGGTYLAGTPLHTPSLVHWSCCSLVPLSFIMTFEVCRWAWSAHFRGHHHIITLKR